MHLRRTEAQFEQSRTESLITAYPAAETASAPFRSRKRGELTWIKVGRSHWHSVVPECDYRASRPVPSKE